MQPCCEFLHHPWHSCISYLMAQDSTPGCGQPTEDHLSLRPLGGVQPSPDRFISCLHSSPTVFKVGDYWGEKSSTMKALVVHSLVVQDREWAGLLPPKGKGPFSHWIFDPLRIYFFYYRVDTILISTPVSECAVFSLTSNVSPAMC